MNFRARNRLRAKKFVKKNLLFKPPRAGPRCAPAAANRFLPAASTTALASALLCRSSLAATRSVRLQPLSE